MAKKVYIQNHTNSKLILQDGSSHPEIIITLQPYECSLRTFDIEYLQSQGPIMNVLAKGYISLQDYPTKVEPILKNKDVGQKFKIGTHLFIVGRNNLTGVVYEYDPETKEYTIKLDKTGGTPKFIENELSLTPFDEKSEKQEISYEPTDSDYNFNVTDTVKPKIANNIIRVNNPETASVNAKAILESVDAFANSVEKNQADQKIIRTPKKYKEDEKEDLGTYIDNSNGVAKEIPLTINKKAEKIEEKEAETTEVSNSSKIKTSSVVKAMSQSELMKQAFAELDEELQNWFNDFSKNDDRTKKLLINEMDNLDKLEVIATFGNYTAKKCAKSKIEKLEKELEENK